MPRLTEANLPIHNEMTCSISLFLGVWQMLLLSGFPMRPRRGRVATRMVHGLPWMSRLVGHLLVPEIDSMTRLRTKLGCEIAHFSVANPFVQMGETGAAKKISSPKVVAWSRHRSGISDGLCGLWRVGQLCRYRGERASLSWCLILTWWTGTAGRRTAS
jgi:hypothetical protein